MVGAKCVRSFNSNVALRLKSWTVTISICWFCPYLFCQECSQSMHRTFCDLAIATAFRGEFIFGLECRHQGFCIHSGHFDNIRFLRAFPRRDPSVSRAAWGGGRTWPERRRPRQIDTDRPRQTDKHTDRQGTDTDKHKQAQADTNTDTTQTEARMRTGTETERRRRRRQGQRQRCR